MTLFEMPKVNLVDAVSAGLLLLAMVQGVIRGLARELGRLITVAVSLTLGLLYHARAAAFLQARSSLPESKVESIAFAAIVAGSMLAIFVGRLLVAKVVTMKLDIKGNKPGGLLAGFLSAAGVLYAVFFTVSLWPGETVHRKFCADSLLGSALVRIMPHAPAAVPLRDRAETTVSQDNIVDEPPPPPPAAPVRTRRHK